MVYDLVLIGSGPAAYAALLAIKGHRGSFAVVTGETTNEGVVDGIHPKIQSVAFERRSPPMLSEFVKFRGEGPDLFSTAEVGGLANYWGQQLWRYGPKEVDAVTSGFVSWKNYLSSCDAIESRLQIVGGELIKSLPLRQTSVNICRPRLLTGLVGQPNLGAGAMSAAFTALLNEAPTARVFNARVSVMIDDPEYVRLSLLGGGEILTRRVLLAGGVMGNSALIFRSLPSITECYFKDHSPYMLTTLGLKRAVGSLASNPHDHFNAVSLTLTGENGCELFASVYSLSRAPLSLLTTMAGLGPWFRGKRGWKAMDFLRPMQVWTPDATEEIRYSSDPAFLEVLSTGGDRHDPILCQFKDWLISKGVKVRLSRAAPGQGFHYHFLRFGASRTPISDVFRQVFSGRVRCIDASALPSIGCAPHSLTAMALAHHCVRADVAM